MPVYRCEVQFTDVEVLGGIFTSFFGDVTRAAVSFAADDSIQAYGIQFFLLWHSYGAGPTYEWQAAFEPRYGAGPPAWDMLGFVDDGFGSPFRLLGADGNNGSEYLGGGVLAIEKDTVSETIRWIGPLGSVLANWADLPGPAIDDSPLVAHNFGHQFDRPLGFDASEKARWKNFYSKVDDAIFHGAALDSGDPGTWDPWQQDGTYGGSGSIAVSDDVQQADAYQSKFRFVAADGFIRAGSREFRPWAFPVIINRGVDMARDREDCLLWQLSVPAYMPDKVVWRRTRNGGRLWDQGVVYQDPLKIWTSPSISYWAGGLTAAWSDGSAIYTSRSYTAGDTWTVPVTLPYTGQNPRHVTEWTSGFTLYFFFQESSLFVARTSDHGHSFWDGEPSLVKATIGAQQIDADFAFDGSIVVTYFLAGAWLQTRSWDMGLSWS